LYSTKQNKTWNNLNAAFVANSQKDSATTQIRYQVLTPARLSALMMMDGLTSRVKRFDSEKEN